MEEVVPRLERVERELNQLALLGKKLEHMSIDLNALRDAALSSLPAPSSPSPSPSSSSPRNFSSSSFSSSPAIAQLNADIEGVRILVRRIESHQCFELNVFAQLRELQRYTRALQHLLDERAPEQAINNLSQLLQSKMAAAYEVMAENVQSAQQDVAAMEESILGRIPEMALAIAQKNYVDNASLTRYVDQTVHDEATANANDRIDILFDKVTDLTMLYNKRGIQESSEFVRNFIIEKVFKRHRDLFSRWVKFTAWDREEQRLRRAKVATEFVFYADRVNCKVSLRCAFFDWARVARRETKFIKYRLRLAAIVGYWIARINPDMVRYIRRWRTHAVLSRGLPPTSATTAAASGDTSGVGDTSLLEMTTLAIKKARDLPTDIGGVMARIGVIGDAFAKVCGSLGHWETTLVKMNKDIKNTSKSIVQSEQNMATQILSQCGVVASNLGLLSQKMAVQLSRHGTDLEAVKKSQDVGLEAAAARSMRLESRLDQMDEDNRSRDARTQRIQLLQADMLSRIEKLEVFQQLSVAKFDKAMAESAEAKRRGQVAADSNAALKSNLSDSMLFFDSELRTLKAINTQISEDFTHVSSLQQNTGAIVDAVNTNLTKRAESMESLVKEHFPLAPHPQELVDLCLEYETLCVQNHCLGLQSMAFSGALCTRMATFCQKFVRYMDEELRLERFVDLVRGTQPGPLNHSVSPSRGVLRKKSHLVDAFVDSFAMLLRDCESAAAPGVVRARARVLFYRRFLRTIGATGGEGQQDGAFAEEKSRGYESPTRTRRSFSPPRRSFSPPRQQSGSLSPPPFIAPPWTGGEEFLRSYLDGESAGEEAKNDAGPTGFAAMPGVVSRGVLSAAGAAARQGRRASSATGDGSRPESLLEMQQHSRPSSAQSRPTSASAVRHLSAVRESHSQDQTKFKFTGSGFKMPQQQSSAQLIDGIITTFSRSVSIPHVHDPKQQGREEDEGQCAGLGTLQTRRLSTNNSPQTLDP